MRMPFTISDGRWLLLGVILTFASFSAESARGENRWQAGDPVLQPGPNGSFDAVSVKDPSILFHEGLWHLFFTARGESEYTTGYVAAKTLAGLQSAPRHELTMIRGKSRYGCAPQVFYYTPQGKWYLIFQNRDSNYQPMFSTTETLAKPDSWSGPQKLIEKDTEASWIDFWVICDEQRVYLFYTQAYQGVMVRTTSFEKFPSGWSKANKVFDDIHEAVHVYKVRGRKEYHMIYELNQGERFFGLAKATAIAGPWEKVTDKYAIGDQLEFVGRGAKWTEMVSHGEAIRSGYDERLEYDPENCRWLIQGLLKKDFKGAYPSLPWQLGIITKATSQ